MAPDPLFVEVGQLRMRLPGLCTGRSVRSGSFLLLSLEEVVQVVHSGPTLKRRHTAEMPRLWSLITIKWDVSLLTKLLITERKAKYVPLT